MADEVQTPLNDGELGIMQPIYTPELAFVPDVGGRGRVPDIQEAVCICAICAV